MCRKKPLPFLLSMGVKRVLSVTRTEEDWGMSVEQAAEKSINT
jgi:hypothetical protein